MFFFKHKNGHKWRLDKILQHILSGKQESSCVFTRLKNHTKKVLSTYFILQNNHHWLQLHVFNKTQAVKCLFSLDMFFRVKKKCATACVTSWRFRNCCSRRWLVIHDQRTGDIPVERCPRNKVDETKLPSPVFFLSCSLLLWLYYHGWGERFSYWASRTSFIAKQLKLFATVQEEIGCDDFSAYIVNDI